MAANTLGYNQEFPIYNADGTAFNGLVLKKSVVDSVVMSLGDKITGDVYYKDNALAVTMQEYVEYEGVRYVLVSPPTIVREGMVADNGQLAGMTKYSFVFYHPMYMLGNFPFTDIAVTNDESKYLSQNKTFSWIGTLFDLRDKLNANLASTEWYVEITIPHYEQDGVTPTQQWEKASELSEVLSFDKQFVSEVLKTGYEQWEIPFVIVSKTQTISGVTKKFAIQFGLPSQEIYDTDGVTPFVFRFGQGVGLKNNSRTPRNNKIVTRLAGYGSERNIPYGYPQIVWTGNQSWDYTINNASGMQTITVGGRTIQAMSYPIYDGIVGGQKVRLIKHPFTRTTLMPTVYVETVNKKVNPLATGYDPDTVIIDYHDTPNGAPNPTNPSAPSFETHQFEEDYPRLDDAAIVGIQPYDDTKYITLTEFRTLIDSLRLNSINENEKAILWSLYTAISNEATTPIGEDYIRSNNGGSYTYSCNALCHEYEDGEWYSIKYTSDNANFSCNVYLGANSPSNYVVWDDSIDDDGNYKQSYFKITLPQLSFDVYACASITEQMDINMRSGACIGCTFPVQVDWEDYKNNFYKSDGTFDPVIHTTAGDGHVRDGEKYPDSSHGQITVVVQKDTDTFGTLMPNIYQKPAANDLFVILGISLPQSYVTAAQTKLDGDIDEYILENNVHYYDYPLKFDEHFLATHTSILSQMHNNTIVRFQYAQELTMALYIKQLTIKYGDKVLPQYDITLTDDVEIVLNQIGQVTDDVSRLMVQVSELQKYYSQNIIDEINSKLSRIADDVCSGRITFQSGLDAIGNVVFSDELRSKQFESGLYTGRGWRIDELGNAEFESARVRSYLEIVELIINRMQAQEGDTMYSDNDQIDRVDVLVDETDQSVSYVLSLKEKWSGYVTSQMYGNILKGTINTLAAKQAGISDESSNNPDKQGSDDGGNKFYTSWMRVIGTHSTDNTLAVNQIKVVMYGDSDTPSGKNFIPCELMTIARWGCIDYSDPSSPDYETVRESITRRQRMFMISNSDGRVVKYTGVSTPKLLNGNYGVTIGELPEFVKNYPDVHKILFGYTDSYGIWHDGVGEHSDWLYAQGIVVQNFIKVSREGLPENNFIDCGEWVDGSQTAQPTARHGIYLAYEYNQDTGQYETHDVWHEGHKWRCLQHQPVTSGGISTYYEPKWNSPYWNMIEGNDNYSLEFESSRGYSFRRGFVDTVVTPFLFYGNTDISADVTVANWNWTRYEERNVDAQGHITYTESDLAWNAQHTGLVTGVKALHLTNLDMPALWSSSNKAIFACTVTVISGNETLEVQNLLIS